jgi:hypothetical protein
VRWQDARLWSQTWRWYEQNSLPWNRARIHREFARRRAFVRWPVHGNLLEAFREGRLEVGEHTLLEPHVWLTAPETARIRIGSGTFLNIGVMVAAVDLVEIGDHSMFANGCFVTDGNARPVSGQRSSTFIAPMWRTGVTAAATPRAASSPARGAPTPTAATVQRPVWGSISPTGSQRASFCSGSSRKRSA